MFRHTLPDRDALRYLLGISIAILALFLRQLLDPVLGSANPYHTAWLGVAFSAWYCGLGPSIVTAVIEAVGVWYWFLPPFHSFTMPSRSTVFSMLVFVIFSAGIIALFESNRRGSSSRYRLAAIVDSSDDAIISKNLDGIIKSWNKGAERVFGYTAAEAIGHHIMLIIPADRHDEEADILARIRRGERVEHFETVRRRKDGALLDVALTISPVRDAQGRIVGASKSARDLTRLKEMEAGYRLNEERLRAAFSQTYSFLAFLSVDGTVREANHAALEGCGFARAEVVGRKLWEPWWGKLPAEREQTIESVRRAANGEVIRDECHYCFRDGSVRFADRSLTPVRDGKGAVVMIVVSGIDITEQKSLRDSLEQRVEERTQELERSNASLRELSGRLLQTQDEERKRIARELHDGVGQLIAAMSMNDSTVEIEKEKLSPAAQKGLRENADLLLEMSKEIRTLSHLLHPPLLDEIGLESAIKDFVDGFAQRSKIAVRLEMPADVGRLPGDVEIALFRVVQECLANIHRHSESATASIRIARENGRIRLEIRDQGKGISAEKLNSLATLGVGLRGMRERLRQLGGTLEVDSNGGGTVVAATLVLQQGKTASATDGAS